MAPTTIDRPVKVQTCPRCTEPVIILRSAHGGTVTVDALPERGGLYGLDEYGQAVRRSLIVLSNELRGLARGEGYVAHECVRDTAWFAR